MQSKITIEVDFENGNEPVIQIISRNTDDIRDKLIRAFIEKLGGDSSWCKIYCSTTSTSERPEDNFQRWKISPINASNFLAEGNAMLEQRRLNEKIEKVALDLADNRPQIIKDILDVMYQLESMPGDVRLTDASVHLSKATELISSFLYNKQTS